MGQILDRNLILCGPYVRPPGKTSDYKRVTRLATSSPSKNIRLEFKNIHRKLAQDIPSICMDMLEIATYVYCADQAISRGGPTWRGDGRDWIRNFVFRIQVRNPDLWNQPDVKNMLQETLGFLSDDNYDFAFSKLNEQIPSEQYFDFHEEAPWFDAEEVILFSGGLDSLGGLIDEVENNQRNALLVSHRPVAKISSRQKDLLDLFRQTKHSTRQYFHVPVWVNKDPCLTRDTNQRTRSFLYAMLAASVANMFNLDKIRFYENGITSANLPFAEQVLGARASRSTHPKVLVGLSKLLTTLFQRPFLIENPFFWKTKSDVVGLIKAAGHDGLIKFATSCSHVRTTDTLETHCGVCSQCIDRRLATLYNDVNENDPPEIYKTDLFTGKLDQPQAKTMVESSIRMAKDLESISFEEFFWRFGEATRILQYMNMSADQAAEKLFELYKKHGRQVCQVIDNMIRENVKKITRGLIPQNSLLDMLLAQSRKGSAAVHFDRRFPTPEGSTWEDVHIEIKSEDSAKITIKGISKVFSALDMGFRDRRKGDLTNNQWGLLQAFARSVGVLSWASPGAKQGLQKGVQLLSKTLRDFLGIPEAPIKRYKKGIGYVARFKIKDTSYHQV